MLEELRIFEKEIRERNFKETPVPIGHIYTKIVEVFNVQDPNIQTFIMEINAVLIRFGFNEQYMKDAHATIHPQITHALLPYFLRKKFPSARNIQLDIIINEAVGVPMNTLSILTLLKKA
ncbi:MAG: hypothetical protein HGB03_02155 [Candidatus Yonathbacteria bacterium]|nr:hypothetical protein [Candidatus Yonathbacteria bacterium]NTW48060.1 hypothetical protein [Candidatus Yonathbacteria bacterium]